MIREVTDGDDCTPGDVVDETQGRLGAFGRDVGDGNVRALRREEHCDRLTDPRQPTPGSGAGTGDERALSREAAAGVDAAPPRRVPRVDGRAAHAASLASGGGAGKMSASSPSRLYAGRRDIDTRPATGQ